MREESGARIWGPEGPEEGEDWEGLPEGSAQGNEGRADGGGGAVGRAGECWQDGVSAGFEVMAHAPK